MKAVKWFRKSMPEQKEYAGTESKSETESLLRKAMEDYEAKKFVGKADNITVGEMLDMWVEEELKPGSLSNGTVMTYMAAVKKIKKYPIGSRKLKTVTAEHLQSFIDLMSYGGTNPDGTTAQPMHKGNKETQTRTAAPPLFRTAKGEIAKQAAAVNAQDERAYARR